MFLDEKHYETDVYDEEASLKDPPPPPPVAAPDIESLRSTRSKIVGLMVLLCGTLACAALATIPGLRALSAVLFLAVLVVAILSVGWSRRASQTGPYEPVPGQYSRGLYASGQPYRRPDDRLPMVLLRVVSEGMLSLFSPKNRRS